MVTLDEIASLLHEANGLERLGRKEEANNCVNRLVCLLEEVSLEPVWSEGAWIISDILYSRSYARL